MKPKEVIEQLQEGLRRRFRLAGPGTVGRVEDALGLSTGYFRDQRRPDRLRLDLRIFVRALEFLAIDPGHFFATTLGRVDPVEAFLKESRVLRQGDRRPPEAFLAVARRAPEGPRREYDLEAWRAMIRCDPANARREISLGLAKIVDERLAEALGLYAAACLALHQTDLAQMVLGAALERAREQAETRPQGEILLIASDLAASQERFDLALRLAETATLRFITAGHLLGIGRSLVQQGHQLRAMGREKEARRAMARARSYLSNGSQEPILEARPHEARQGLPRRSYSPASGLEASHGNSQILPR